MLGFAIGGAATHPAEESITAMHRQALTVVMCGGLLMANAGTAAAQVGQPWIDRGYASLNVAFESASGNLNDATTFRVYDEDGSLSVAHAVDSGALVDLSLGARVWRNVSVGIGFHTGSTTGESAVQASVPSPIFFGRPRPVAQTVGDLNRTERAVHIQFGYMLVLSDRLNVHVIAGPSFFRLKQEVVSELTFTEQSFPFTAVTASPVITERNDSATGFNVGADVGYQIYQTSDVKLGAGMFIRYANASVRLNVLRNEVDSDAGGLQIGFGGRVRF